MTTFLVFFLAAKGQFWSPLDSIKVLHGGQSLQCAWAGGLNNAQFSNIDLNFDGAQDLWVFDRSGNRISTYLNKGGRDTIRYIFSPQYVSAFPTDLIDWSLLHDINCDEKPDILTSAGNGIKVYYNTSDNNQLSFALATNILNSNYGGGLITNLYVSRIDIPAVADMDGDGDLDVLTFPVGGTKIEYHRNYSVELGMGCSLENFKLEDPCWGKVEEDFASNAVYLNVSCRGGGVPVENNSILHAGSTVFAFDSDGDSDMDVVLGDISFPKATFLLNGGDKLNALVTQQDSSFPSYETPININIFPALFSIDVNNDGQNDILACPNSANASDNISNVWYYKDIDTSKAVRLELQHKNFLQNQMIDVGEGAYPVFFDFNNDGLLDLIIGNNSYKVNGVATSKLVAYKNTGTLQMPQFTLESTNYANLLQYNPLQSLAPCFGDLDYDGDADMLLGCSTGQLLYFENIAGPGLTANFVYRSNNYQNIDVGNYSKPTLFDLDGDERLDLIIGGSDGRLTYFRDTVLSGPAGFKQIKKNFGAINLAALQNTTLGYASPQFVKEKGKTVLYLGSAAGPIVKYTNIDNNLNGIFLVADSAVGNIYEGYRTHVALADIDNNGKLDMAIGNFAGGVRIYASSDTLSSIGFIEYNLNNVSLEPNPVNKIVSINNLKSECSYYLFTVQGSILTKGILNSENNQLYLNEISSGLYFLKLETSNQSKLFKLIKH